MMYNMAAFCAWFSSDVAIWCQHIITRAHCSGRYTDRQREPSRFIFMAVGRHFCCHVALTSRLDAASPIGSNRSTWIANDVWCQIASRSPGLLDHVLQVEPRPDKMRHGQGSTIDRVRGGGRQLLTERPTDGAFSASNRLRCCCQARRIDLLSSRRRCVVRRRWHQMCRAAARSLRRGHRRIQYSNYWRGTFV